MPDLDANRIAAAALAVVDEHGVAGFTMRTVADALGVTPMALYHHVNDKAALAALVVDAAIREQQLPSPTGRWQDDMMAMAYFMRQVSHAHPAVSHLRRAYRVWTPAILPMTERWFGLWQQSGLDLDNAVLAAATSSMAIVGLVEEELAFAEMDRPGEELLRHLPNARLAFQVEPSGESGFELVVRSLIEGMHARLSGGSSAAASNRRPSAGSYDGDRGPADVQRA